ncbi:MAG: C39 family peptidase [Clostridiales Family XIII bacterium]|jgi:uncharacterized protein YvpB|nr:C39 family peptidase [Clostridiales Family XIII bacterium]
MMKYASNIEQISAETDNTATRAHRRKKRHLARKRFRAALFLTALAGIAIIVFAFVIVSTSDSAITFESGNLKFQIVTDNDNESTSAAQVVGYVKNKSNSPPHIEIPASVDFEEGNDGKTNYTIVAVNGLKGFDYVDLSACDEVTQINLPDQPIRYKGLFLMESTDTNAEKTESQLIVNGTYEAEDSDITTIPAELFGRTVEIDAQYKTTIIQNLNALLNSAEKSKEPLEHYNALSEELARQLTFFGDIDSSFAKQIEGIQADAETELTYYRALSEIEAGTSKKTLDAPYINQRARYPTGCESVSAVMALQYIGIDISVDTFIDEYLALGNAPHMDESGRYVGVSPWKAFPGNPYTKSGWGCFAPVIKDACDKILDPKRYEAEIIYEATVDELCARYIQNDIPVIFWATMGMAAPHPGTSWVDEDTGEQIEWVIPMHCLLLVGYDADYYYFNDPQKSKMYKYRKSVVKTAYEGMFEQAVVIKPVSE